MDPRDLEAENPLIGVPVCGPGDAALLLQAVWSAISASDLALLVLDRERRIVAVLTSDWADARCPAVAIGGSDPWRDAAAVVVASLRRNGSPVPSEHEVDTYVLWAEEFARNGLELLDWLVVTHRHWCRIAAR